MSQPVSFLYLSQADVKACGGLDMAATIAVVEQALQLWDAGACVEPPVAMVHWGKPHRERMTVHPAFVGGDHRAMGLKWIGSNPDNPRLRGLPRASGLVALVDPGTGLPLALMDGTLISAMRTGAVVGAAAKLLAPPEASVVALLGAGVIARTQLLGLQVACPHLEQVRVYDLDRQRAETFAVWASDELGLEVIVTADGRSATRGAHLVAPATHVGTDDRYIHTDWLEPGAFLANVSLNDYLPEVVLACARVVVDTRRQLETRGLLLADVVASGGLEPSEIDELGALLRGARVQVRPGSLTLFSPNGMGVEDVLAAHRIYHEALRSGAGTTLPLWTEPIWI
jgi:ornithine cyclodeaminase/alanine dehydrogenase-like protein (mu-crystallin family)